MGSHWSQYELLALIPLRRLTAYRYPPTKNYSLIDFVKKEVFPLDLNENEEEQLRQQFDVKKTLWILDGYDEIIQNIPSHLQPLVEQLLKTPCHIITSRPYLNTLSSNVQMEIIGFTDENIQNYIQNFFHQINDELDDAFLKSEKLLNFLQSNPSIWGVAHIPVNLELICSLWSSRDWSETKQLTMTRLYTMMIEWLCRRYLAAQGIAIQKLSTSQIYERCQNELAFLDSLAFSAMESNTIIIRPVLLKKASNEAKISSEDYSHILNMGILKSVNKNKIASQIETDKDHYFVHLSFQEYFAAKYLINALKGSRAEKSIEFIRHHKYNQRYTLLFSFAAGLLNEEDAKSCSDIFWGTLLGPPVDLVGIRHIQLVIACLEETDDISNLSRCSALLKWIANCLKYSFITENQMICHHLLQSLQRSQSIACDEAVVNVLIDFLQHDDVKRKVKMLLFISKLKITNPSRALIKWVTSTLDDKNEKVREYAYYTLGEIGEKIATIEIISKLVRAAEDESELVRRYACRALGTIGEKARTHEVIDKLVRAVDDPSRDVRAYACEALGKINHKAGTNEVIDKLVRTVRDRSGNVRGYACAALGEICENTGTNEVISELVCCLGDQNEMVRRYAQRSLEKMGEKAATNRVISKLMRDLENQSECVRRCACRALGQIGEKAATNEVISRLVIALEDQNEWIRASACEALGKIGEKAGTNEVINKLIIALEDQSKFVRASACETLGKIDEKSGTNEVISKLVGALDDQSEWVRECACKVLGKIGEKAATNELIDELVNALENESESVRRYACEALGKIGEKAATNEVIGKLLSTLEDQSEFVRASACDAVEKIGGKAGTDEMITKLVSIVNSDQLGSHQSAKIFRNIISSSLAIKQLDSKVIVQLFLCNDVSKHLKNISENDLINIFCETENLDWLSALIRLALLKGTAVIVIEDKVVVYGKEEKFELLLKSRQLCERLVEAFTDQKKQWHLHFEMPPKTLQ
jgi:HEAT repeat protein